MGPKAPETNPVSQEGTVFSQEDKSAATPPPNESPNSSISKEKDLRSITEILKDLQDTKTGSDSGFDSDAETLHEDDAISDTDTLVDSEQPESKQTPTSLIKKMKSFLKSPIQGFKKYLFKGANAIVAAFMTAMVLLSLAKIPEFFLKRGSR